MWVRLPPGAPSLSFLKTPDSYVDPGSVAGGLVGQVGDELVPLGRADGPYDVAKAVVDPVRIGIPEPHGAIGAIGGQVCPFGLNAAP